MQTIVAGQCLTFTTGELSQDFIVTTGASVCRRFHPWSEEDEESMRAPPGAVDSEAFTVWEWDPMAKQYVRK